METDIVSVRPQEEVPTLLKLMREHELPGVPVVDEGNRLVGIVTESDLVMRDEEADLHLPHHIDLLGGVIFLESMKHYEERLRRGLASTVAEMMTENPIAVSPEDSVHEAGRIIAERKHNRLPVVDSDGRLLGVVTRVDVLAALVAAE
jgi:CBS domain-containing protein